MEVLPGLDVDADVLRFTAEEPARNERRDGETPAGASE
jgi:hypothetical protein